MSVTPFYIYRHIRPDTNEVFYIGKGNNLDKRKPEYARAFDVRKRSVFWKNIFNVNNQEINTEIMFECENESQANEKEIEFIKLYGRKNLGLGTLANMTNGGDGSHGLVYTKEMKDALMKRIKDNNPRIGKKHSTKTKQLLSIKAKQRKCINPFKGKKHAPETIELFKKIAQARTPSNSRQVINVITGEIYESAKEASNKYGYYKSTLSARNLSAGYIRNHTPFVYLKDYKKYGKEYCLNLINKKRKPTNAKKIIDIASGKIFDAIIDAANYYNLDVSTLRRRLDGTFTNTTNLRIYDGASL